MTQQSQVIIKIESDTTPARNMVSADLWLATVFGNVFVTKVEKPSKYVLQKVIEEVKVYKAESCISLAENTLSWCKAHQFQLPVLSHLLWFSKTKTVHHSNLCSEKWKVYNLCSTTYVVFVFCFSVIRVYSYIKQWRVCRYQL